jgi:hypothetical protein
VAPKKVIVTAAPKKVIVTSAPKKVIVIAALKKAAHYGHRLFINILKNQHACLLTGVKTEYGKQKRRDRGKL